MLNRHPQSVLDPNPAVGASHAPKVLHPLRVALEARRYNANSSLSRFKTVHRRSFAVTPNLPTHDSV